jgi:hypothetical protein
MPTETEELRLVVRLDDQASSQLQNLRAHLTQLGSGPVSQSMGQATAKATELEKAFGHLSRSALGVGRATMDVAKIIGPLPVAIGVIGYEFIRQLAHMKEWAGQMTAINNAARMAGVSAGNFRGITDGLRQSGINAGDAAGMVQSLTKSISEAIRPGSQLRNELISMAGVNANAMTDALQQLSEMTDATDRMNKIRQMGLDVYANNFNKYHDEMRARAAQLYFLQAFGQQQLINQKGEIHKLDKLTLENMDAEAKKQDALNTALTQEEQTRQRIWDIIKGSIASQETAAVKVATKAEGWGQRRLETFESQRNAGTDFMSRGAGGVTGQLPGTSAVHDFLKAHGLAFQHGGIINRPTPGLVGEAGSEAVMPLDLEHLGVGRTVGSKHVETIGENTKQLKQLNDQMDRILNPSMIDKYARGMGGAGTGVGDGTDGAGPGGTSDGAGPGGTSDGTGPAPGEPGGPTISMESARMGMNPMWDDPTRGSALNRPGGGAMGAMAAGGGLTTGGFAKAPEMQWPAEPGAAGPAGPGYGASGATSATGAGITGNTSIAALEHNPRAQAAIARFAEAFPNVTNPKTQLYSLVRGETNFGHSGMITGKYSGYFQLGPDEAYGRMGLTKQQFAALPFDQQLDAYTANAKRVDPSGQHLTNLGLWNAAGSVGWQTKPLDTIVYDPRKGGFDAKAAAANARTWGAASGQTGGPITIAGIEKYYGRNDPDTNRQIAAAGVAGQMQVASTDPTSGVTATATAARPMGIGPFNQKLSLTGSGINPEVLAEAAKLAGTGNEGALRDYIRKQGLDADKYDCGEFIAAVMKKGGAGGQIPGHYQAASSFLKVGTTVPGGLAAAQPGDIITKIHDRNNPSRALSPGETGGHQAAIGPLGVHDGLVDIFAADTAQRTQVSVKNPGYWKDFRVGRLAPDANAAPPKSDWPNVPTEDTATTLDKMMAGENKGGDSSGTITIKHGGQKSAETKDKKPAFKDVPDNRQGTMLPADAGPKAADTSAHVQG